MRKEDSCGEIMPLGSGPRAARGGMPFSPIPRGMEISPLMSPTGITPCAPGTFTGVIRFTFQTPGLAYLKPSDHVELAVPKFNWL